MKPFVAIGEVSEVTFPLRLQPRDSHHIGKVDPAETRTPVPSNFFKNCEPGSIINRMVRKISARGSDPACLRSSPTAHGERGAARTFRVVL